MAKKDLAYEGCNFLRQRLILSTLSGKTVKIKKIRSKDDNPGLRGIKRAKSHVFVAQTLWFKIQNVHNSLVGRRTLVLHI